MIEKLKTGAIAIFLVCMVALKYCSDYDQAGKVKEVYIEGEKHIDTFYTPEKIVKMPGKTMYVPEYITVVGNNFTAPEIVTVFSDTTVDENVKIVVNDTMAGKTDIKGRSVLYELFVPIKIVEKSTDTLKVYEPRPPSKHWVLGPSAGAALTPMGVQPYVGLSITYKLFEF